MARCGDADIPTWHLSAKLLARGVRARHKVDPLQAGSARGLAASDPLGGGMQRLVRHASGLPSVHTTAEARDRKARRTGPGSLAHGRVEGGAEERL